MLPTRGNLLGKLPTMGTKYQRRPRILVLPLGRRPNIWVTQPKKLYSPPQLRLKKHKKFNNFIQRPMVTSKLENKKIEIITGELTQLISDLEKGKRLFLIK
jgi:hypothetical protein